MTAETKPRRTARRLIGPVLVMALGIIGSAAPAWIHATGTSVVSGEIAVSVTGIAASPIVSAAALMIAAAGLALGLAGRVGQWIAGGVIALGAILVGVSAGTVIGNPVPAAAQAVGAQTGIAQAFGVSVTAWPYVTIVAAVILLIIGIAVLRSPAPAMVMARFDRPSERASDRVNEIAVEDGQPDTNSAWDAMSRGEDPS